MATEAFPLLSICCHSCPSPKPFQKVNLINVSMLDLKPYEKTTGSVIPLYCLLVHNHSTLQQQESSEQSAIWLKQNLHRSHTWYLSFCRIVLNAFCRSVLNATEMFPKRIFFYLKLGKIVASTGMVISVGHHARKI